AVCALLAGDARLVTLTGPGGIGKTRLAIDVAEHAPGFPDGRWFVALAPIRDARLVLPTIAHTLELQETAGPPLAEQLLSILARRHALLALDNVEQIPDLAPVVAGLLDAAPALKILATSRALLRVSGEHEFPVSPLALPTREVLDAETIATSDAVTLF